MNPNRLLIPIAFLLVFFSLAISPLHADDKACLKKTCFEKTVMIAGTSVPLRGIGLGEFFQFDMYTAAFYGDPKLAGPSAVLGQTPRKLVLHYHRKIKSKWIIKSAIHMIKKNPKTNYEDLEERMTLLAENYKNVGQDDEYTLTYVPGQGTELALNGESVVSIPGDDFARAYFGIWLSETPINEKMMNELLGGAV